MLKRVKLAIGISCLLILFLTSNVLAITAVEIMEKVDDFQYADSLMIEAQMVIVNGNRQMEKEMVMYGQKDSALVEFTNPRDRGAKFLKIADDLWMFFPDAEEVVKISGHMLEQGLMGSDFSYQDAMESEKFADLYNFEMIKEEKLAERPCYVIEAVMKEGAKVSYYRRLSWIDAERFVILKEELYARSGRLLKVFETKKVERVDDRWYITQSVMENKLKKNTKTEFQITSIQLNVQLDQGIFSLQNLH